MNWREVIRHPEALHKTVVEILDAIQSILPIESKETEELAISAWLWKAYELGLIQSSEYIRVRNATQELIFRTARKAR